MRLEPVRYARSPLQFREGGSADVRFGGIAKPDSRRSSCCRPAGATAVTACYQPAAASRGNHKILIYMNTLVGATAVTAVTIHFDMSGKQSSCAKGAMSARCSSPRHSSASGQCWRNDDLLPKIGSQSSLHSVPETPYSSGVACWMLSDAGFPRCVSYVLAALLRTLCNTQFCRPWCRVPQVDGLRHDHP